jgi:hypothetical protein
MCLPDVAACWVWYSAPMSNRTDRTANTREAFLQTLAQSGNVTGSCEELGISRTQAYHWRNTDPEFAQRWDEALELGADALEDEAKRRALGGSDYLMAFLLRGLRPERYKERATVDLSVRTSLDVRNMSIAEIRERLAQLRAQQDDPPDRNGVLTIEADNVIDLDKQR